MEVTFSGMVRLTMYCLTSVSNMPELSSLSIPSNKFLNLLKSNEDKSTNAFALRKATLIFFSSSAVDTSPTLIGIGSFGLLSMLFKNSSRLSIVVSYVMVSTFSAFARKSLSSFSTWLQRVNEPRYVILLSLLVLSTSWSNA